MKKTRIVAQLSVAVAVTAAVAVGTATGAGADPAPTTTDVVGVGSDIVQNSMDFIADGYTNGDPGYNTAGNKNRLIDFDATSDGNGRNAFTDPSLGTSVALNPTITLRAGTSPVQRPNGGTAGLTALINDGSNKVSANRINFARSPNLPTAAQQTAAAANLGSQLHVVEIAKDQQVIATAKTTNAPTALSVQQLLTIYTAGPTTWSALTGGSDKSTDTIIPEIPQTGAGVRTIFLNALKAANGNTAPTLGSNVVNVQQNDPTTITGLPAAQQADAIVPFPVGRYKLLQDGYFKDPTAPYNSASPPASVSASGISLQQPTAGVTPTDGKTTFDQALPYYIIFRDSDLDDSPWQPGSTLNWAEELFSNPGGATTPYVETAPAQAILTDIGVTPFYADLGVTSSG
jgi:ABC-type phosphate transport system substrate-binding protein